MGRVILYSYALLFVIISVFGYMTYMTHDPSYLFFALLVVAAGLVAILYLHKHQGHVKRHTLKDVLDQDEQDI